MEYTNEELKMIRVSILTRIGYLKDKGRYEDVKKHEDLYKKIKYRKIKR